MMYLGLCAWEQQDTKPGCGYPLFGRIEEVAISSFPDFRIGVGQEGTGRSGYRYGVMMASYQFLAVYIATASSHLAYDLAFNYYHFLLSTSFLKYGCNNVCL